MIQYRESKNDRVGLQKELEAKIDQAKYLSKNDKTYLKKKVEEGTAFSASFSTAQDSIIRAIDNEILTMEGNEKDIKGIEKARRGNIKKAKKFVGNIGKDKIAVLEKTTVAIGSVQSAVVKFEDGKPKNVISGVLDIGVAISNFLPPPASTIMGPITGIFNSIFGIGGPSTEEVIQNGFKEQKEFLESEFSALNAKITAQTVKIEGKIDDQTSEIKGIIDDHNSKLVGKIDQLGSTIDQQTHKVNKKVDKQTAELIEKMESLADDVLIELDKVSNQNSELIKQSTAEIKRLEKKLLTSVNITNLNIRKAAKDQAVEEMLLEQRSTEELLVQMHIYFGPLEGMRLDKDEMTFLGTQINIFSGQTKTEKTKQFIRKYCKATDKALSTKELRLCNGLMFHWIKTSSLMDGVLIKFTMLLRLSEMNQAFSAAKTEVLKHRQQKKLEFIREIFHDRNDYCNNGGFGVFGCIARGREIQTTDGTFTASEEEQNMFQAVAKSVGDTDAFKCEEKSTRATCGMFISLTQY